LWNQTSFLTTPLCQALSRNSGSEFAVVRLQHTHTRARMLGHRSRTNSVEAVWNKQ